MQDEVKLNPGDSAVIIRHEKGEDKGFEIEIYHRPDDELDGRCAILRASDSWYGVPRNTGYGCCVGYGT